MGDRTTRPIQKISRKYTFIILAVLSGIIGAIWVAIDNYVGTAIIDNEYAFAIQSMLIGIIVSILFVLILWIPISKKPLENLKAKFSKNKKTRSIDQQSEEIDQPILSKKKIRRKYSFLGQYIDPQFYGIKIPNKKMFLWLGLSGFFSGIQTLVYFILIKNMDISVFLPASQFVVVYLIIGDLVIDKSKPAAIEIQSIIMIIMGVMLAAIDISSSGSISWVNLVLVFLVLNSTAAIYVIFQKKAVSVKDSKGITLDSTNIRLWTLFFMSFFTIIFTLPFMKAEGWSLFKSTFVKGLFPIAISMLLVYIARIFYVRALSMGKMSIVNTLSSISVVAGIPITLIGHIFSKDAFILPTGDYAWIVWLLRGIGAILVFVGIVGLSMSEVKIMIFAKVKGGEICDIAKIKSIPGVERVSAITGRFDLMIILRSRTIGRGYQPIVDQLASMPCLDEIVSSTILKEWNA
ncbi:MAG: Lrp/AsnC ligand binding domain-containing protein [Candidatus Heimdallarchaeota archaeon]|nr:Lrp/AsnC ligand binding domain-containing protein [Candidatus Heimdallarchaeota archaeon]